MMGLVLDKHEERGTLGRALVNRDLQAGPLVNVRGQKETALRSPLSMSGA